MERKEAIEIVRKLYNESLFLKKNKEAMVTLIPELAESKDEKIRKTLMQNLKERFGTKGNMGKGLDMPDVLAWLEKQCEHAKFRDSIQVGDKVTRNQDGVLVNLSQLNRVAKKDEKQSEQKSAEWSEEDYNKIETIACHLDNIDNEGMAEVLRNIRDKYYSQTTWKPSDEQMELLDSICASNYLTTTNTRVLQKLYDALKKLKE